MKVSIVSFSSHANGNCESIAKFIQKHLNCEVDVLLLSQLDIHGCGKCQYECFDENKQCPYYNDALLDIYRHVANSDFCFMLIPNYSGVPCANYFKFRERSQCVWQIPFNDDFLWQTYAKVDKHFFVIANTDKEVFAPLLKNEVENEVKITFISSNDIESKSMNEHLINHTYYQDIVLDALKRENLINNER